MRAGDEHKWRRTALTRADGSQVPDDWCLVDPQLGPIARIYRVTGGPRDGQWCWAVQIDEHARPWNSGTGYCPTGREEGVRRTAHGVTAEGYHDRMRETLASGPRWPGARAALLSTWTKRPVRFQSTKPEGRASQDDAGVGSDMAGDGEAVTRRVIAAALKADMQAAHHSWDMIYLRRERAITILRGCASPWRRHRRHGERSSHPRRSVMKSTTARPYVTLCRAEVIY